jgi:tRNA (guanosine-2'-O-)-methyltransferase
MSQRLYDILKEHLTERKRDLFERVVNERTRHLVMVIEDVYQTHNASAILRSMESWGVQDLYAIENTHSLHMHHRIAKGAQDWLTVHNYREHKNNSVQCLNDLKSKGYKIVATALDHRAKSMHKLDVTQKTALVMGTELSGVSEEVLALADETVMIPMHGFTESLNVSVASAVLMQDFIYRLRKTEVKWQLTEEEKIAIKIDWARKTIYWSQHLVDMYEAGEI